jgi:hypothetical protein
VGLIRTAGTGRCPFWSGETGSARRPPDEAEQLARRGTMSVASPRTGSPGAPIDRPQASWQESRQLWQESRLTGRLLALRATDGQGCALARLRAPTSRASRYGRTDAFVHTGEEEVGADMLRRRASRTDRDHLHARQRLRISATSRGLASDATDCTRTGLGRQACTGNANPPAALRSGDSQPEGVSPCAGPAFTGRHERFTQSLGRLLAGLARSWRRGAPVQLLRPDATPLTSEDSYTTSEDAARR